MRAPARCLWAVAVVCGSGCSRAPIEAPCPNVAVGELVITELRGGQAGADTLGEWLEIYNASSDSVLLGGLRVRMVELDGGGEKQFLVRDTTLEVAAGSYAVLGAREEDRVPAHMDYGFASDGVTELKVNGIITLEVCGEVVDQVVYRGLPAVGTWGFDGAEVPSAEGNDDEDAWCTDDRPPDMGGPMIDVGTPGSPGEANLSC